MQIARTALVLLAAAAVHGATVTPIEKVISLLSDLRSQVQAEGAAEAKNYEEFACYCKDTTSKKSDSIQVEQDTIDSLSAAIAQKTAESEDMAAAVQKRKDQKEALATQLKSTSGLLSQKQAEYEAASADLSKAISSLNGAIKTLESSKPTAMLMQGEMKGDLQASLDLADALNLVDSKKAKTVSAFLQGTATVDPSDPSYKFASQGIIDILEKLLKDYQGHKGKLDAQWESDEYSLKEMIQSLGDQISEATNFIKSGEEKIDQLSEEIATNRESLVESEGSLKDDQLYLKDLTGRCEEKAKDWDQRTQVRGSEITALTKALGLLEGAAPVESARALLQDVPKGGVALNATKRDAKPVSFLQLARAVSLEDLKREVQDKHKVMAVELLKKEGNRLQSQALLRLIANAAEDPFVKVKGLIQGLLERLLKEAASEATKKGFCDTELSKAEQDRDYRFSDVKKLNSELEGLEVKLEELAADVAVLKEDLTQNEEAYSEAAGIRAEDKKANLDSISAASEGLDSVKDAILILKSFYKQAAKGKSFLQKASPVDEDAPEAADGEYKGKQEGGAGVIAILQVIQSDFERTMKTTKAMEKKQYEEFVVFERISKADYASKFMTKTLDEQDIVKTKAAISRTMDDLTMNMGQVDDALKTYEELTPMCVDTGMTYAERVAAREAEIDALKKALCILDADKVEPDCQM